MKSEKLLKLMFIVVAFFFLLFSIGFYFMFSQVNKKAAETTTTTSPDFFEVSKGSKYYAENSQIPTFEYFTGIAPDSCDSRYNIITYHHKAKKTKDIDAAISVYMDELSKDGFEEIGNTNTSLTYSKDGAAVTVELTKDKEVLISFLAEIEESGGGE